MDDRLFRNAMGKFATGVTVISTEHNGDIHGMTANAFMSISLNPKLVLISIGEKAKMLEKIQQSKKYAVNILSHDQQVLSMNFAGQLEKPVDVQFEQLGGLPVIKDALAQISCQVVNEVQAGDHCPFHRGSDGYKHDRARSASVFQRKIPPACSKRTSDGVELKKGHFIENNHH